MMKAHRHLSDDQLIELCLAGECLRPGDACVSCESRHAELTALLHEVSAAAVEDADEAFPPERLARQQARILQRLEHAGRPGRVIAFPGHAPDAAAQRTRPSTRWIAAAAVAGLVIGLVTGQVVDFPDPAAPSSAPVARATDADTPPPAIASPGPGVLRAVATTFSEEEFLDQIESIAESPGGDALRPLHDVTPRAWEVE